MAAEPLLLPEPPEPALAKGVQRVVQSLHRVHGTSEAACSDACDAAERALDEYATVVRGQDGATEAVSRLTALLHAAKLAAWRRIRSAQREELLRGGSAGSFAAASGGGRRDTSAEGVSAALRRTRQLMAGHLDQGAEALQTLAHSTEVLRGTNAEMRSLRGGLAQGSKTLRKINERRRRDAYYIWGAFLVFAMTVIYILYRRTLAHILPALGV